MIGVSPWYWWADVPVKQRKTLALHGDISSKAPSREISRHFHQDDENWGLNPWASKMFDPNFNIRPKTTKKFFN